MNGDKVWILKVLSGPHVGSEAMLSCGVYVLGRDAQCDIILNDASLVAQHFQLTVAVERITLQSMAKDHLCFVDGVEVASNPFNIEPYQVVSTGTLFFALGPVYDAWPPLELLAGERRSEKAEQEATPETPAHSAAPEEQSSPPSSSRSAWASRRSRWRKRSIPRIYLSVGTALIGIGASLLFTVFTTGDILPKDIEMKAAEVNALLEDYVLDASVRTVVKDGRKVLQIEGYTQTDAQREAFMEALGKASISAQTQLYSVARLKHAITVILEQLLNSQTDRVEISKASDSPAKVTLSGYVERSDVWRRVLQTIKADVPGLKGYNDQVHTLDDALSTLNTMLEKQGLAAKANATVVEHAIYLDVQTLSSAERQRWHALHQNFRKLFGPHPPLIYQEQEQEQESPTKESKPLIKQFNLGIALRSISFGKSPYLETQDGERYTVGATLGDGYVIKEINRSFLLLLKGGELGRYHFNVKSSPESP